MKVYIQHVENQKGGIKHLQFSGSFTSSGSEEEKKKEWFLQTALPAAVETALLEELCQGRQGVSLVGGESRLSGL